VRKESRIVLEMSNREGEGEKKINKNDDVS